MKYIIRVKNLNTGKWRTVKTDVEEKDISRIMENEAERICYLNHDEKVLKRYNRKVDLRNCFIVASMIKEEGLF